MRPLHHTRIDPDTAEAVLLRQLAEGSTFDALVEGTGFRPIIVSDCLGNLAGLVDSFARRDGRVVYYLNQYGARARRRMLSFEAFVQDFIRGLAELSIFTRPYEVRR